MTPDRLVVCPECDGLVIEDEWYAHRAACRPTLLCNRSEPELYDLVNEYRKAHGPGWAQDLERMIQAAAKGYDPRRGSSCSLPTVDPTAFYAFTWDPNAAKPVTTTNIHSLTLHLPPGLGADEVEWLAREQLTEQYNEIRRLWNVRS